MGIEANEMAQMNVSYDWIVIQTMKSMVVMA